MNIKKLINKKKIFYYHLHFPFSTFNFQFRRIFPLSTFHSLLRCFKSKIHRLNFQFSTFNFQLNSGFTFIELLLVVALLSIITGVSTIFYSRFLTQNAVDNTVDQIMGSFRKAQMYALSGKKDSNWGVNYSSNTITLYSGNSYSSRNFALDENYTINDNITVSGIADINFSRPNGLPSSTTTVTVNGGNNTKTITINEMGVGSR